jgi:hypothetical protein
MSQVTRIQISPSGCFQVIRRRGRLETMGYHVNKVENGTYPLDFKQWLTKQVDEHLDLYQEIGEALCLM